MPACQPMSQASWWPVRRSGRQKRLLSVLAVPSRQSPSHHGVVSHGPPYRHPPTAPACCTQLHGVEWGISSSSGPGTLTSPGPHAPSQRTPLWAATPQATSPPSSLESGSNFQGRIFASGSQGCPFRPSLFPHAPPRTSLLICGSTGGDQGGGDQEAPGHTGTRLPQQGRFLC